MAFVKENSMNSSTSQFKDNKPNFTLPQTYKMQANQDDDIEIEPEEFMHENI